MTNRLKWFFCFLFGINISILFAQDTSQYIRCATPNKTLNKLINSSVQNRFSNNKIALVTFSGVIVIPVVFHVVHNNVTGSIGGFNISDDQINSQIQILNNDYRKKIGTKGFNLNPVGVDTEIEFQLAKVDPNCNPTNGITRHLTTITSFDPYSDDIKQFETWPTNEYLNIWVGNLSNKTLGIAQFPNFSGLAGLGNDNGETSTDGIVLRYNTVGERTPRTISDLYYLGRTATHEIGHWLGLLHPWGFDVCGDDFCNDTPQAQDGNLNSDCKELFSICNSVSTKVMIENYMDYSPDICMNIFTADQKNRMRQALTTAPQRSNLLSFMNNGINSKCIKPATLQLPVIEDFEDAIENVFKVNSCQSLQSLLLKGNENKENMIFSSNKIENLVNDSLTFSFDYIYLPNNQNDTLFLIASTGCKTDKISIATFVGSKLTANTFLGSNFVPSCSDWQNKKFKFTSNFPFLEMQFKTGKNQSGSFYFDNIKIEKEQIIVNRPMPLKVKVWGNPIENKVLNLEYSLNLGSNLEIEIYDILGAKVLSQSFPNAQSGVYALDISAFNSGIFFVKSKVNEEIAIDKVFVL